MTEPQKRKQLAKRLANNAIKRWKGQSVCALLADAIERRLKREDWCRHQLRSSCEYYEARLKELRQ